MCLYPDCDNEAVTRGLCATHYGIARKLVKGGHTTWEELIAAGKAEDVSHHRRGVKFKGKAQAHFLTPQQLDAARAEANG